MRRRIQSRAQPRFCQNRRQCRRRRPLPIRPRNQHRRKPPLRIAQRRQQNPHLIERKFPPRLPRLCIQLRRHGVQLFDCCRVGHRKVQYKSAAIAHPPSRPTLASTTHSFSCCVRPARRNPLHHSAFAAPPTQPTRLPQPFQPRPVGAADNHGRYLTLRAPVFQFPSFPQPRFRKLSPIPTPRPHAISAPIPTFPTPPTGAAVFSLSLLTHTHPSPSRCTRCTTNPIAAQLHPCLSRFLRKGGYTLTRCSQSCISLVFQKCSPVFHAPFHRRIATIGLMNRRRFRLPASCCTVRA